MASKRSGKKERAPNNNTGHSGHSGRTGRSGRTEKKGRWALLLLVPASVALFSSARFLLVGIGGREVAPGRLRSHNLLFVTIDTLRADRLGSYGSTSGLTPRLDRLASEGIVFENVLSHVPLTLPSHASIFTGMYPTSHGVHDNGTFRLARGHRTLASVLRDDGYRTAAFVGAFVLDARFGLDHGFEVYDDFYGEKRTFLSFVELERPAEDVLAAAERWLEDLPDTPWFAWVHLFDPHAPYDPPEEFRSRRPEDPYGSEVAYVDETLGRFLDRLEASGRLESTLVVVAGDHGESLGEHGELTHGTFAYNATLRVPWILWARDLAPARFSSRARLVDVVPTVLDLLGVGPPGGLDGTSLRPFLHAPSRHRPPDSYFEALNPHLTRDWAPLRGIVSGEHKLIDLPVPELYDLASDPDERRNLAAERAGTASELARALRTVTAGEDQVEASPVDEEVQRRLASLGYTVSPNAGPRKGAYTEADDPKNLVAWSNAQDEAGALFSAGRTEEALSLLRKLLEDQPRSSFAHQKLAYALHQAGRIGEAVAILEEAVRKGLSDVSLLSLLGSYWIETGGAPRARDLLEPLVEAHPDFAEAKNLLGVAYARLGRAEDAEGQFEAVLALDPSSASAHNNLGSLSLARGDVERAVEDFDRALALDPGLASAHNGLGVARSRRGDVEGAIESWRRSVALSPRQFDALYNLAMALAEREPQEAIPFLERFSREAPPESYGPDVANARALLARLRE